MTTEDDIKEIKKACIDFACKIGSDIGIIRGRLEHIENYISIEDRISAIDVLGRLDKLEKCYIELQEYHTRQIDENRKISRRVDELEELLKRITEDDIKAEITPYKCPVCEGKGFVFLIFSITDTRQEECRSCEGKGILWG
jgi:hypothetical protein